MGSLDKRPEPIRPMGLRQTQFVMVGIQQGIFGDASPLRQQIESPESIDAVRSCITRFASAVIDEGGTAVHVGIDLGDEVTNHAGSGQAYLQSNGLLTSHLPNGEVHSAITSLGTKLTCLQAARGRNAFRGSRLDDELARQPRQTLVLAGLLIGGILDATCRTAYQLGYDVQVLGDGVLSMGHAERDTYLGVVIPEFAMVTTSTLLMAGAA